MAGAASARELAVKLGRQPNFLIGIDKDDPGALTVGSLDIFYAYLSAYQNADKSLGSWKDWNAGGTYVNVVASSADQHQMVPMYTVYTMAAMGENRTDVLMMQPFMQYWWDGMRLLFTRVAAYGKPAIVHLEPDFWGYMQQKSGGTPSKVPVLVKSLVPECNDLTDDLAGLGACVLRLGHKTAPKAAIGFHISEWGGSASSIAAFLKAIGSDGADFLAIDGLDRDAGCFEAHTDPNCQRGGKFYLDETNTTHPNYSDLLATVKTISDGTGKPILMWQIPFGVPSDTPGGTAGHYRDNHVHYIFGHIPDFIAAGFAGAAFGAGAANQTGTKTDGDQFKNAVTGYSAHPVPLP
jgi:hypothetical protein